MIEQKKETMKKFLKKNNYFFNILFIIQNILNIINYFIDLKNLVNIWTLLYLHIRNNLPLYIYKFLLHYRVNINTQNNNGDTTLNSTFQNFMFKTIDFFVKIGVYEYIDNKMRQICWECL